MSDEDLRQDLQLIGRELERFNRHRFLRIQNSFVRLMLFNLARGMAFGLGTVLGASVILSIFVWSLSQVEFVPIIGDLAAQILEQMKGQLPQ
ncbi:hypothetical protein ROA7450_00337 [Roseovarius albus]|uniref:Uncharacterized protein n=1 Tax=Roseovarius albus TaxID=1247867 RepID=A0A1X6YA87_9RHOB|nr:DUF5665 domain-containing protein [Roseovarius albus]SLN15316.1 hypothetical protein ROA7450_00337 [Roseovarius albus]